MSFVFFTPVGCPAPIKYMNKYFKLNRIPSEFNENDDIYPVRTEIKFTCLNRQVLRNDGVVTCMPSGAWSADIDSLCVVSKGIVNHLCKIMYENTSYTFKYQLYIFIFPCHLNVSHLYNSYIHLPANCTLHIYYIFLIIK